MLVRHKLQLHLQIEDACQGNMHEPSGIQSGSANRVIALGVASDLFLAISQDFIGARWVANAQAEQCQNADTVTERPAATVKAGFGRLVRRSQLWPDSRSLK